MSFFTDRFAGRIGGASFGQSTETFKFEAIKRAKRAARAAHPDIPLIDLGVGEPDEGAFPLATETLAREAPHRENRFYADNGIPEFKSAAARYLARAFGVAGIEPESEVMHCIGTKSALATLPLAFIDPGDVALVTVPGYPILATHTRYLGGEAYSLPLLRENGFLPDLDSIPRGVRERSKLLYLNYPNNPTGARATESFFREVVDFARANRIVVVHDAAYGALVYGDREPLSFLSVPGAKDVGVELHSLSKAFNMTGWRLGFVAGNAEAVAAFASVKDTVDSGQFRAIQLAGAAVLERPELTASVREKYSRRLDLLVGALRDAGFDAEKSAGTFYCYVRSPRSALRATTLRANTLGMPSPQAIASERVTFASAAEFSDYLIRDRLISSVPWDDAGSYVRFSVTYETASPTSQDCGEAAIEEERRVMADLRERLVSAQFGFD